MLVLSRRVNEEISFPLIGVTLKVLGQQGNKVRLGVEAPQFIEIRRGVSEKEPELDELSRAVQHRIRNELSAVQLGIALYERQLAAGDLDAANHTFLKMISSLRRAELEQEEQAPPPSGASATPGSPRVLVVDDDANERELLAGILRMDGCSVVTAEDGLKALELLADRESPDVLLLDMHMPRCDGRETLAAIRSSRRHHDLLVFAVSGSSPDESGVPIHHVAGVDEWFEKPLNPRRLVDLMRSRIPTPRLLSL